MPSVFDNGDSWLVDNQSIPKSLTSPEMNLRLQGMAQPTPVMPGINATPVPQAPAMPEQNMSLPPQAPMAQPAAAPQTDMNATLADYGINIQPQQPQQNMSMPQQAIPQFAMQPSQSAGAEIQQQTTTVSPETKAEVRAATGDMRATENEVKASLERQAVADNKAQEAHLAAAETMQRATQDFQAAEQKRQELLDQQLKDFELAREAAANHKNEDFWQSKEGGNKVLAAIAVAMGGVAAGLTGGANGASQIINSRIEQFAQKQKADYEQKSSNVTQKGNIYAQAMKQTGDARLAEMTVLDATYKQAEQKIQAFVAGSKSEQQRQQGLQLLAGIQQNRAQVATLAKDISQTVVNEKMTPATIVPVDPATGRPMNVPKFSNVKEYYETLDRVPGIAQWREAEDMAKEADRMTKGGKLNNVMLSKYIAGKGGLNQGSFSEKFMGIIQNMGMKNWTDTQIEKFLSGQPPKAFIDALVADMKQNAEQKYKEVYPTLQVFERASAPLGVPGPLSGRTAPQQTVGDKAAQLGLVSVRGK